MTCAEAIAHVLRGANRPLTAREIAEEINAAELYRRRDGQPLPPYQVSALVHGDDRFLVDRGRISLNGGAPRQPTRPHRKVQERSAATAPTAVLIGCVSHKEATRRPAKDLYRTELFRRRRAYAEGSGRPWLIVSARHGLLEPDEVIEPYDVALSDLEWPERHRLSERIAGKLEERFGPLEGQVFEVHAGDEYMRVLGVSLREQGVRLENPLRGMRIGEQLQWYGKLGASPPPKLAVERPVVDSVPLPSRVPGLAREVTQAFMAGQLDLSRRADAPAPGWGGMPEVLVAERLRAGGASDRDIRLLLTFTAAMDRARDADRLWFAAEDQYRAAPWAFDPQAVVAQSVTVLADLLRRYRVSQRHGPDAFAWRVIAESLTEEEACPAVQTAVLDGRGDAAELLASVQASSGGTDRFPFLRGPKVGPMWVRMLAHPGNAAISSLETLPVAVDVQVRKVSEFLGASDTGGLDLEEARPLIQAIWDADVRAHGALGPEPLAGTAAALDPALWFWGKWGCTRCEGAGQKVPIGDPCARCRFPHRAGAR